MVGILALIVPEVYVLKNVLDMESMVWVEEVFLACVWVFYVVREGVDDARSS